MEYVYAKLVASCVHVVSSQTLAAISVTEAVKSVIMRFENEEECENVSDHMFDSACGVFNEGLPEGWVMDDGIELDKYVTKEDAEKTGYVVYRFS